MPISQECSGITSGTQNSAHYGIQNDVLKYKPRAAKKNEESTVDIVTGKKNKKDEVFPGAYPHPLS